MTRARRLMLLLTLAALVAATVGATPAEAAKRKVPFGFFAAVIPPELSYTGRVSDTVLDQQMALMATSGVEAVRITLAWEDLEPSQGRYVTTNVDRLLKAASAHKLQVLFNITQTPQWASSRPDGEFWRAPPRDSAAFGALMGALATRYGPTGTFWTENPTLPRAPIRHWQIWNEQNAPWHWSRRPWGPSYVNLLKASYQAIKGVDRGATVVAGSFVAAPSYSQWAGVRDLYRVRGAKRWFDQIAIHPFTNNDQSTAGTIAQMTEILTRVRAATRKAGDGRVPLIITELTWPASVGKVPRRALLGVETTPRGQIARLKAGYTRLVQQRRKLNVRQAYWYTWASQYDRGGALSVMSFRYAGLTRVRNGAFSPMPILRVYRNLAVRYEGCRKSADATRCR